MKLCPHYVPAHTSYLDSFQPTVKITGGKYSAYANQYSVYWCGPLSLLKMMKAEQPEN